MLSNTCKYAIRAVIYISLYANAERKVGIKKISEELDIPTPFLGKILQSLAKHKILDSVKGPNGGFCLARKADDINLMDIVDIIDGTNIFETCLIRTSKCSDGEPCAMHDKVSSTRAHIKNMFVTQSIQDLSSEFRKDKDRIRI